MKKKKITNLIFVVLIVCILAAGVLGAGYIRGWFDRADPDQAVLTATKGITELLRDGVRFAVNSDTPLRKGDVIFCQDGATAQIRSGSDSLSFGEKAKVVLMDGTAGSLHLQVDSGDVFTHCQGNITLSFERDTITLTQATALLSVRSDIQSVGVFRGTVKNASAGQIIHYTDGTTATQTLDINSLNDFTIAQIRQLDNAQLCFSAADLDRLAAQRQQAIQELINGQKPQTGTEATQSANDTPSAATEPTTSAQSTQPSFPAEATQPSSPAGSTQPSSPAETTQPTETTAAPTQPAAAGSCTIAIYCHTILNNMGSLDPAKAEFVPGDGAILYPVTVEFTEGETVFDVLKRVCSRAGIQLEYSWTPLYDSYYVEGIHQLYEFDCGFESGWMYQVNGWFPNYGCSSYQLKDGDTVVWAYTCQGLGADLGARMQ